ncbi:prolyl oligopeptidase family serine peptidase [Virgibacillus halophilus]|uniref:Prolyl oligopeptidase family serine peptidase n=1 Tax=Tigheibacillus halophilus TaxID=361280 RepID=A0ABU5CA15_9BACI|nr:prolyl oligopeptidase family serine peptidase [Virgibacillus halophilus]
MAYLLAEKGFRVMLPDSKWHGQRENGASTLKKQLSFFEIVLQNVADLETIKNYLQKNQLMKGDNFGIAGTSMGGITTCAALTKYPWIKAAACLMGSPKLSAYAEDLIAEVGKNMPLPISDAEIRGILVELSKIDLSKQPEKLQDRPLLFWHGDADPVVPFNHSSGFYKEVSMQYGDQEKIHFIKEEKRGHKVSRFAILETVDWFVTHLQS